MFIALTVAALLASSPQTTAQHSPEKGCRLVPQYAVDLHPMSDEEKRMFPGRERFDKTEWYESQFKSAKTVVAPGHVDEWDNGGIDFTAIPVAPISQS